jgi:hypothetical protein
VEAVDSWKIDLGRSDLDLGRSDLSSYPEQSARSESGNIDGLDFEKSICPAAPATQQYF